MAVNVLLSSVHRLVAISPQSGTGVSRLAPFLPPAEGSLASDVLCQSLLRLREDRDYDQLCQNDDMWCLLNNLRQSFQTWIRNLGFDLLLGFNGERRTDDGEPKKLTLGLINFLQVFAYFID